MGLRNKKPRTKVLGIHYKKLDTAIHPTFEKVGILAFCNKLFIFD